MAAGASFEEIRSEESLVGQIDRLCRRLTGESAGAINGLGVGHLGSSVVSAYALLLDMTQDQVRLNKVSKFFPTRSGMR